MSYTNQPYADANGKWISPFQAYEDLAYDNEYYGGFEDVFRWSPTDDSLLTTYNGTTTYYDPIPSSWEWTPPAIPDQDQVWGCASCGPGYEATYMTHYYANNVHWHYDLGGGSTMDLRVAARTWQRLYTGGKAGVGRRSLFCIHAGAMEYGRPPLDYSPDQYPWWDTPTNAVPNNQIRVLGKWLGADGNLWIALPDNASPYLNLTAYGVEHYDAGATVQKVVPDVQLAVDRNHDRSISFGADDQTSPENPFRFWVNDVGYSGDIISSGLDVPGSGSNGSSGHVNGRVDVINFFPVKLRIGTPNLTPPDPFEYRLGGSSSLYFAYADPTKVNDFDYLTDASGVPAYGSSLSSPPFSADTVQVKSDGVKLSDTFTNKLFQNGGIGTVLMEAAGSVTPGSPLQLQVYYHGQQIYSTNLYLSISGVEDMYRQINLRGGYTGIPAQPPNNPDVPNGKMFVFVHGYNVNATESRGWNAEMFKRLYWSGSHAMFTGIDWQGDQGQIPLVGITPDYYENVVNAFYTSLYFASAMRDLPGEKYIAAHSLGNMVVSSAIQDWSQGSVAGFQANTYFMIDAAVSLDAYNANLSGNTALENPAWTPYSNNQLEASYWFQLFGPTDARHSLTWQGRFADVSSRVNLQNYYSSTEDVLTNSNGQLNSIFQNDYCWVNQEMRKGTTLEWLLASSEAGWGFNSYYYNLTVEQANALTPSQLLANSFFRSFADATLYSATHGSAEAAKPNVQYQVLADGIPALSNAAGGPDGYLLSNSHNMYGEETGWPQVRLNSNSADHWLHSDIKNIAYPFNHSVFDNIAGSLQ